VISIGNLSTGGSGKTPLAITLAKELTALGFPVDVLSRGYGRESKLAARVLPEGTAEEFGDEPLLIAREAGVPVYVAAERYEAGLLAEAAPKVFPPAAPVVNPPQPNPPKSPPVEPPPELPGVHLLDDGFQHRQLYRDVDILLLDRENWKDGLLPAGNLRESLYAAHRATVIAIPAGDTELESALRIWGWLGPIWRLRRRMDMPFVKGPLAAFCGIARPDQFFQGIEAGRDPLAFRIAFPDHYRFTAAILEEVISEACATGAKAMVTTEKDVVRLGKLVSVFPKHLPLIAAKLTVEIEYKDTVMDWLIDRILPGLPQKPQ